MTLHDLTLAPSTENLLASYIHNPTQGILLSGTQGSGLGTTARMLAASLTLHSSEVLLVTPDEKGIIPIERIRSLYIETRAVRSSPFVIIIDDADTMSRDAQNSFLKLLEEPVDNVYFILTAHVPEALLATILSRVQTVVVRALSQTASESLLRRHHVTTPTALQQILFIASGRPAELVRLASDKDFFEAAADRMRLARDFLTSNLHERLTLVSRVGGREEAQAFVATVASVLKFTSERDAYSAASTPADVLETVAVRLASNGHVRTQLMYLAMHAV